jgi:hypothetical protein
VAVGPPLAPYGGLAATNEGLIAENIYWNAQTTLRPNAAGNNTGTAPPNANGLTSAQMSTPANFVSWDSVGVERG